MSAEVNPLLREPTTKDNVYAKTEALIKQAIEVGKFCEGCRHIRDSISTCKCPPATFLHACEYCGHDIPAREVGRCASTAKSISELRKSMERRGKVGGYIDTTPESIRASLEAIVNKASSWHGSSIGNCSNVSDSGVEILTPPATTAVPRASTLKWFSLDPSGKHEIEVEVETLFHFASK